MYTPFEQNKAYLNGSSDTPASNIIPLSQAPSGTTEQGTSDTTLSSGGSAIPSQQQSPSFSPTPFDTQSGSMQERITSPITTGLSQTKQDVTKLQEAFKGEVGPQRSWENIRPSTGETIGGTDILGTFTKRGGNIDDIIKAEYKGPTGLSAEDLSKSSALVDKLYARSQGLNQGPTGLMSYIQSTMPSMTPGKARMEAGILAKDTDFMNQLPLIQQQVEDQKDWILQQQKEAENYATQRATQESDIKQRGIDWLQKKADEEQALFQNQATQRNAEDAAQLAAAKEALAKGTLPEEYAAQVKGSDVAKGLQAAKDRWGEIMGRYPELRNVPTLTPSLSSHGVSRLAFPAEWEAANKARINDALIAKARLRQEELEKYFSGAGEFGKYIPLYGTSTGTGENQLGGTGAPAQFALDPIQSYAYDVQGTQATPSNVLSDQQRAEITRILEALGQANPYSIIDQPYTKSKIGIDIDKYLADEAAKLQGYSGDIDTALQAWQDLAAGTRKSKRSKGPVQKLVSKI